MLWVIGAIVLGLILGVLGYYFSKTAYVLFFATLITSTFFVPEEFLMMNQVGDIMPAYEGYVHLGGKLANLPEYIQWAGLFFVISFFVARIIIWVLATLNVLPEMNGASENRLQRGIEEYNYNPDENHYC